MEKTTMDSEEFVRVSSSDLIQTGLLATAEFIPGRNSFIWNDKEYLCESADSLAAFIGGNSESVHICDGFESGSRLSEIFYDYLYADPDKVFEEYPFFRKILDDIKLNYESYLRNTDIVIAEGKIVDISGCYFPETWFIGDNNILLELCNRLYQSTNNEKERQD